MKKNCCLMLIVIGFLSLACSATDSEYADIPIITGNQQFEERWASSENLQITINRQGAQPIAVTSGHWDYKPSWSPTLRSTIKSLLRR